MGWRARSARLERKANMLIGERHDRLSPFAAGVPGPFSRRGRLRRVSCHSALAGRLPVPGVRAWQGMGAFDQTVHLGECAGCGKQTSVTAGTAMHGSKLALTVWFSDGHPFQRHLRPATAETTGARFVQDGVAARRPASPRHGGARPLAAEGLGRDRRDRNSAAAQGRSARRRSGPQPPRQDARRRRRRGAR